MIILLCYTTTVLENSRMNPLFILFNRMPFSYPFCYVRFKIRFLVSFPDLHTFLPLVHVNLLWPSYPSLSPLRGDINFFSKFQRYTNFQKRKFTISITVSVLPFRWYIISFLGNSFEDLFSFLVTWLFAKPLSRPRVRSKIRIPLRTFHSILGACTKCDTWFSTLYVKSESLPLFTYSWQQEDNSLNKHIV